MSKRPEEEQKKKTKSTGRRQNTARNGQPQDAFELLILVGGGLKTGSRLGAPTTLG